MFIASSIAVKEYYVEHVIQSKIEDTFPSSSEQKLGINECQMPLSENELLAYAPDRNTPDSTFILAKGPIKPLKKKRTLQVNKGDTLSSLLAEVGASQDDIDKMITALKGTYDVRDLRIGQTLVVTYQHHENDAAHPTKILKLEMRPDNEHTLTVKHLKTGLYRTFKQPVELFRESRRVDGKIYSSFFSEAAKRNVPARVINEAATALSYIMNFQHSIKKGDAFEILYDVYKDKDGNLIKTGMLRYVAVMANGHYNQIYRFDHNGQANYYDAKGQSIVRTLLQTPLDPAKMRVSSHFGMRMHPIKGYMKSHKGVDFGAPSGTAIMSAGDGVVVKMGYYGAYGNYVKIRHASGYETAYAHLSSYARGLKTGIPVQQRQVIGYVGATGSATGPHLHFELIYKGAHVNPMNIKQIPRTQLKGKDLDKFKSVKRTVETQLVGLVTSLQHQTVALQSTKTSSSLQ
jgi:murein DD-endopeptidase MepM/ murein hydrolase activator NlpD